MQVPGRDEFLEKTAGGRTMPVYRDVLADMETPLSAYWKLASDEAHSFLLESVTGGEQLARYSIIGTRPRAVVRSKGRAVQEFDRSYELEPGQDPLDALASHMPSRPVPVAGLPKFIGGAVGFLGYDYVRFLEKLPGGPADDVPVDDMAMMVADTVVVFDHAKNLIRIIVLAKGSSEGYDRAVEEIERVVELLQRPLTSLPLPPPSKTSHLEGGGVRSNMTRGAYEAAVQRGIDYIGAGDCIQVVLSQRFSVNTTAHPLTIYRALRSLNPSPYMFLLRLGDMDIIGASPEILVSLQGNTARVRPIAGTRPRGATPEEDERLADELLADEKERAEHIMLVDLGRNDIGRVAEYGSVKVNDLMVVERYSHVMHIVSDVTGTLPERLNAINLLRATFPAGTVSGAPKVRAMQIIDELEPARRGVYAGAVGYLSATGDMDTAIAIRTIVLKDGTAHVQAGAGIVYDSIPSKEHEECENKARACLRAIEIAERGLD